MTIPNKITLLRVVLAFVMTVFLTAPIPYGKTYGLLAFALAGISDYLDGVLARRGYGITSFGQFMDPLADKVLVCAAFISFVSMDQVVPAWIVVAIMTREFTVTGLRLIAASDGVVLSAGRWGKHKTAWQIVCIVVILVGMALREDFFPLWIRDSAHRTVFLDTFDFYFGYVTYWASFAVALLTVVSGGIYFWQERHIVLPASKVRDAS